MGESLYWCQGDFIAPKGHEDYISAFACTGGIGCHEQRQKFESKGARDARRLGDISHLIYMYMCVMMIYYYNYVILYLIVQLYCIMIYILD